MVGFQGRGKEYCGQYRSGMQRLQESQEACMQWAVQGEGLQQMTICIYGMWQQGRLTAATSKITLMTAN